MSGREIPWDIWYPRPRLVRDKWLNLNGSWDFYTGHDGERRTITVPFAPESRLSGIGERIPDETDVDYARSFTVPEDYAGNRLLLHFGAVDQTAEVYLNGQRLGFHEGGYTHFSFDITDIVRWDKENRLLVHVSDRLDDRLYPYGKQKHKNGGMWYTPVTGIWQTVWIEPVPEVYIRNIHVINSLTEAKLEVELNRETDQEIVFTADWNHEAVRETGPGQLTLDVSALTPWTPEDPVTYPFTLQVGEDRVSSYLAVRTLSERVIHGIPRILLNGKPYYFHGVLDQGYFDDGIYTPESPEAYRNDLLMLKSCGFNMLRKHIKVEPDYFYYLCDIIGLAVFQDMVNNGTYSYFRDTVLPTVKLNRHMGDRFINRDPEKRAMFKQCLTETIEQVKDFSCIVYYTIFNEGWGQFEGSALYRYVKALDQSRIVDTASGWFDKVESDVCSEHIYFKDPEIHSSDKPYILSEYGGYTFKTEGHLYHPEKTYGYGGYETREAYQEAVEKLMADCILPQIEMGLCADIYTQLSDVEDEINGLITYDRKIIKVNPARMKAIGDKMRKVYEDWL